MLIENKIITALKLIHDPEVLISIWDLGLIYNVDFLFNSMLNIRMTLTSFFCPLSYKIFRSISSCLMFFMFEVQIINIEVLWAIKWSKDMMCKEARFVLDLL